MPFAAGALEHLAMQHPLAEQTEAVDHQLAVEVVLLVLDRDREQAVGGELEGVAVAILRAMLASHSLETDKPVKPGELVFPGKGRRPLADVRELSLAHVGADKVARAYQRDPQVEKRRHLMADWAAYQMPHAVGQADGGNVVTLFRKVRVMA